MSSEPADRIVELARSRPPTLGAGRLVAVDGPAGSGKTTLAAAVSERTGAPVIHMDDLYPGWGGLPQVADQLETLLRPLAAGEPGRYRRYDWHQGRFAETVDVPPGELLLVLEGVGSGSQVVADLVTVLVWVEAPHDLRMRRGIERDGDAFEPHWHAWAEAERVHFTDEGTRDRADVVVDGAS